MRKHKCIVISSILIILTTQYAKSEENFEDADQSSDFLPTSTNTNQNYDLRHTIPGEPGVDYPIYFTVPKTSFKCTGRHEGYYADTESRCQAFRICAHTARSAQGFGFLCPNGTLFSQKNFVCDWYRNVNCDDSERYYSKNDINRVGSSYDMMETVRQMMEYPMKTISKALQQNSDSTPRSSLVTSQSGSSSFRNKLAESSTETERKALAQIPADTRKSAVTRAQIESAYKYVGGDDKNTVITESKTLTASDSASGVEHKSAHTDNNAKTSNEYALGSNGVASDDVYVNSLGELSSDRGANFDETKSRIIAKAPPRTYHYGQKRNFAEKVNEALEGMVELPANDVIAPDYVKKLRSTDEGTMTDLASNVNALLDEVQNDLDPSMSGYQIPIPNKKHSFKFLSRGFSAQGSRGTYVYSKPKQTASTVRFSPNQIPIDSYKTSSHDTETAAPEAVNKFIIADDAMKFSFTNIIPKPNDSPFETLQPPAYDIEAPAVDTLENTNGDIKFTVMPKSNEVPFAEDAIEFTIMTTTPKAVISDESYLTAPSLPPFDDVSYLEPPRLETTDNVENTGTLLRINVPDDTEELPNNYFVASSDDNLYTKTVVAQTETPLVVTTFETALDNNIISAENLHKIESTVEMEPDELTAEIDNEDLEIDHVKLSVNQHAENLLLSGVKLSIHDEPIQDNQLPNNNNSSTSTVEHDAGLREILVAPPIVKESTIYGNSPNFESTTTAMRTSTETVTEISSTQQRIRNYRRFATLQRASVKPIIYAKRAHVRAISKKLGSTASTTKAPSTTSTTRSYLKRIAASRSRLSRLGSTGRNGAGSPSILNDIGDAANEAQQPEKKIKVRNSDRETATLTQQTENAAVGDDSQKGSSSAATWESVRNNLQRYVSQKRSNGDGGYLYTTVAPVTIHTTRAGLHITGTTVSLRKTTQRSRNRYSSFKLPQQSVFGVSVRTTTTTVPPITAAAMTYTPQHHPTTSSSSYSYTQLHPSPAPLLSTEQPQTTSSAISSPNLPSSSSTASWSSTSSSSTSSSSISSSSSPSSSIPTNFLSFDKLTRAIVDDSILQNFRSDQANAKPSSFSSSSSERSVFGGNLLQSNAVPSVSSASSFSYEKPKAKSLAELTPPVRPQHLPIPQQYQQQTASALPITYPTQQTARIVIARAEGQRIEPNSVHSIISNLAAQKLPKSTAQAKPYVPLDDFLTHTFGSSTSNNYQQQKIPTTATTFTTQQRQYVQQQQQKQQQQQQQPQQQQQQKQQQQPQQQQQQPQQQQQRPQQQQLPQQLQYKYKSITSQQQIPQVQQQRNYYQQPIAAAAPTVTTAKQQYPNANLAYIPQQQQLFSGQNFNNPQLHQQLNYPQQQSLLPLQPLNTQGIFATYKQHQKQLPQFPPLLSAGQLQQPLQQNFGNFATQQQQIDGNYNQHFDSLNVKLPALPNGLIPAPTNQFAQKRSDFNVEMLELNTDPPARSYLDFAAASSYDVPLSSIGRLPNDRTQTLRRLRRH